VTPLEFCLELSSMVKIDGHVEATKSILDKYQHFSTFPDTLRILDKNEVEGLIEDIRKIDVIDIIGSAVDKSQRFAESVKKISTPKST
jgi:hypothetical protein